MDKPVYVTQSTLPPLEEYTACLKNIFESHQLTNHGPHVARLERNLAGYLDSPALLAVSNGTLGLQLAIRHLGWKGKKVITTPFTYVATVSALLWEGCEPVFADIDPDTLCISPDRIREQLQEHSDVAGILPVHVFGNACDVAAIGALAAERGISVLYDAAHAFGSRLNGKSLFAHGDLAVGSFHSTKLFHTIEGGCIVSQKPEDMAALGLLRAFGHIGEHHISPGINAKMSEAHAAMGLCLLPRIDELIRRRATRTGLYDRLLLHRFPCRLKTIKLAPGLEWNHAYYPLLFEHEETVLKVSASLGAANIHPRRYFHPALTNLPYLKKQSAPLAESAASRILCLPLWPDMEDKIVEEVAEIVGKSL